MVPPQRPASGGPAANSDPFAESPVARRAPKPQATVSNALFGLLDWQTDGRGEEAGLMAGDPDHDHDEVRWPDLRTPRTPVSFLLISPLLVC